MFGKGSMICCLLDNYLHRIPTHSLLTKARIFRRNKETGNFEGKLRQIVKKSVICKEVFNNCKRAFQVICPLPTKNTHNIDPIITFFRKNLQDKVIRFFLYDLIDKNFCYLLA